MYEKSETNSSVVNYATHAMRGPAADTNGALRIAELAVPSPPTVDICDARLVCRMAKKVGCHFCKKT